MSQNPDSEAAFSEAAFSLVSCISHFDTSQSGEITTLQDAHVVFHSRLELCKNSDHYTNVIVQNIKKLGILQSYIQAARLDQLDLLKLQTSKTSSTSKRPTAAGKDPQ